LAAACHVTAVAPRVGHIPPKLYIVDSDALAPTTVEKENPRERKLAPGRELEVTVLAVVVVCLVQVPLPIALSFEGVNRHSEELLDVEHVPV
jgi:hypothetical protein